MNAPRDGAFALPLRHFGSGSRTGLALHCALAHGGAWTGVADALQDLLKLTAPDLPGHGRAPDWTGDDYAGATLAHLADLLAPGTDLLGHSFGGVLALHLAARWPERVRSLTLIEPVWFALVGGTANYEENEAAFAPVATALAEEDYMRAARAFTAGWGGDVPFDQMSEKARQTLARQMPLIAAQQSFLHGPSPLLKSGRLEALELPVLLLEGTDSPRVVCAIQSELERRLPNAIRKSIEGASHMLPITHPLPVSDAIRLHLETT